MSQTRDPNSTYCRRCGAELVWEHPKGSGHYQMSSDYVGSDICRSCLEEQRSMPTGAAEVMDEDVTKISVTLYQAPFAVLSERGLLLKMHDHNRPYAGPVPSQYYMPVFHGNLEFRGPLPQDLVARRASILENFFALYNRDDRPNPKTSRSMSVGDVVKLDGQFYLCAPTCFTQVDFKSVELNGPVARLVTPDGSTLEVSVFPMMIFPASISTYSRKTAVRSASVLWNTTLRRHLDTSFISVSIAPRRKTPSTTTAMSEQRRRSMRYEQTGE